MNALSFFVGLSITLAVLAIALAVLVAYLYHDNDLLEARADQADAYMQEADGWKANYYAAAAERDKARRRITALTGALELSTDITVELSTASGDAAVIAQLERQFTETTPEQEL